MTSTPLESRQTHLLRKNRLSKSEAFYFVTFCTESRKQILDNTNFIDCSLRVLGEMEKSSDWKMYFQTVMPEHIHVLFSLGDRLSVSQVIGKYKAFLRRSFGFSSLTWQSNFFEHRLRDLSELESIGIYMFMNPYQKGLIPIHEVWNGLYIGHPKYFRFLPKCVGKRTPQPRWLKRDFKPF